MNTIKTLSQLDKFDFEIIEEDLFWNYSSQKEYKMHKVHIYPAKFPSLIVKKAFEYARTNKLKIQRVGDVFCGCGTVAVESKKSGYDFWGCDINPVAVLLSKVKSLRYDSSIVRNLQDNILLYYDSHNIENNYNLANQRLKYWFVETQYNQLYALKNAMIINTDDDIYRSLFLCIFSSILKSCSKWLSSSIKPQIDHNKPIHNVRDLFIKQTYLFINAIEEIDYNDNTKTEINQLNVLDIELKDYVDMIITSPPYVTSYEYADLHQLSSLWLNYADDYTLLRENSIGSLYGKQKDTNCYLTKTEKNIIDKFSDSRRKLSIERYFSNMNKVIKKIYEILKLDGISVIVIGDTEYQNIKIENARCIAESMILNGFEINNISKRKISNKFLPSHRDESGRFTSDKKARKIYNQEYIIIGRKYNG